MKSSVNDSMIKRLSLCKITAIFFSFAGVRKDKTLDGDSVLLLYYM